jgi:carbonic anhydrase
MENKPKRGWISTNWVKCLGNVSIIAISVRNVGNMVPHAQNVDADSTATEPAALELGCKINGIKHVIVCGHSDCKAMNLLYTVHKSDHWNREKLLKSPIKAWLSRYAGN